MLGEFMQAIPIEQQGILIGGLIALFLGGLAGAGYLFRVWVLQKIAEDRAEIKIRLDSEKAKHEKELLEVQAQLDATQSGREMQRLYMSEFAENRKEAKEAREAMLDSFNKRDEQFNQALKEMVSASQGLQSNTAATLELLKTHAESDETMRIKQDIIMKQNDSIQSKIIDLTSSLDAVIIKVDSLANQRVSDKKILEEIHAALLVIQSGVKRLEENQAIEAPKVNNGVVVEIKEVNKELSQSSEETPHE